MAEEVKHIRLSHTLLYLWERGLYDDVVSTYFHMDRPRSKAMIEGTEIHKKIEDHIMKFNSFPDWFFEYELLLPEAEKEVIVDYNEHFSIKGYFDCVDVGTKTLFEFKSGVSNSLEWARTKQIPLYFLMAELAGMDIEKAFVIRYDQKKEETDFCIVHNSEKLREDARNTIDSVGPEILDYFIKEGFV